MGSQKADAQLASTAQGLPTAFVSVQESVDVSQYPDAHCELYLHVLTPMASLALHVFVA